MTRIAVMMIHEEKLSSYVSNATIMPVDRMLGFSNHLLKRLGLFEPASQMSYEAVKRALHAMLKLRNYLVVEGEEHVPENGGVVLASNHQSWLDVNTLIATCPRRVHFIAKAEFRDWPLLRELVELSESVFIRRGGDERALDSIVHALQHGWAVSIFPEGTIPGEETIPRRAVDPRTGLLRGYSGAVRLALRAKVPIVPVGISGTGRSLPPEVYPRMEILRVPAPTPIRVRYGAPIDLSAHFDESPTKEKLRELTDDMMMRISELVDHRENYAPIEVPVPEPPKVKNLGVLLLHGFTGHTDTVAGLVPRLKKLGIPYELPVLRGHGTRYENLVGVTAKDWYVDAEHALIKLWNKVDQVIIVGLSMGGLVALELAMRHPDKIAGIVTLAAALRFVDKMAPISRLASAFVRYLPSPNAFHDEELKAARNKNYERFPVSAFASLYEYSVKIAERLGEVHVPIRILQSKKDQIVAPVAANVIFEKVSSSRREIIWYERSGHEMLLDLEADAVARDVMAFVESFREHDETGVGPA